MPEIPVNSPLAYLGVLALVFGGFLILAGLEIVHIEKIIVKPGAKTWGFGFFLALIGIVFLLPEILRSLPQSATPAPTMAVAVSSPTVISTPSASMLTDTPTPKPILRPTDMPTLTPTNTPPALDANCKNAIFKVEDLGLWVWGQVRPPMPTPAGLCEVILAHGDINDSGTCHVKEFKTDEIIQGLGNGTFRLLRISGNPNQIKTEEAQRQQTAAAEANGSCPWLLSQTPEVEQFCITDDQLIQAINGDNPISELDRLADTQAALFIAAVKQLNPGISDSEAAKIMNEKGPRNRCDVEGGPDEIPGCGPRNINGESEVIWDGGPERVRVEGDVERKDLKILNGVNIEEIIPRGQNVTTNAESPHSGICVVNR